MASTRRPLDDASVCADFDLFFPGLCEAAKRHRDRANIHFILCDDASFMLLVGSPVAAANVPSCDAFSSTVSILVLSFGLVA